MFNGFNKEIPMKPRTMITFAAVAVLSVTTSAIAGDKFTPKRDLPNEPTRLTEPKLSSTVNEISKPIEHIKPEDAFDKAMNAPVKSDTAQPDVIANPAMKNLSNKEETRSQANDNKRATTSPYKKNKNKKKNKKRHNRNYPTTLSGDKADSEQYYIK